MQINSERLSNYKFLTFSLLFIGLAIVIADFFGKDVAKIVGNSLYTPVAGIGVVLSLILAYRFRGEGTHGKAWIIFTVFIASWFVAEEIWMVYDLIYDIDPFPSPADLFYLLGYPFYFFFMIFYLKSVKKAISKKILISTSLISVAMVIPTLYFAIDVGSDISEFERVLAATYPIADAIILIPAMIGMVLFFKGEVNFMWSLMSLAIVLNVVADTGFLITNLDDSYYTGSLLDMLFLWAYVLFIFGIYSHIKIFKTHSYEKEYCDIEDLK